MGNGAGGELGGKGGRGQGRVSSAHPQCGIAQRHRSAEPGGPGWRDGNGDGDGDGNRDRDGDGNRDRDGDNGGTPMAATTMALWHPTRDGGTHWGQRCL